MLFNDFCLINMNVHFFAQFYKLFEKGRRQWHIKIAAKPAKNYILCGTANLNTS